MPGANGGTESAVDSAIESFWRDGLVGTTTRSLQRDLGLSADEIEATFGTKKALRNQAVDAYLQRVDATLVAPLDSPQAGLDELCEFLDGVHGWVTSPEHPGCMLVNLLGESGPEDEFLASRSAMLRERLEGAFGSVLERTEQASAQTRTAVLIAAFFGICLIARSGAGGDDVRAVVESTQQQVRAWGA